MTGIPIRFGVQASFDADVGDWLDLAVKAEDLGFDALYVADHPGITAAPFTALAAAAAVTTTLRLGTYVVNCGVRDPLTLAGEVATLDQLSNGRAILGLGAGHTPAEWTMSGLAYPSAGDRVGRLAEMIEIVTALLQGDVVTYHGRFLQVDEAAVSSPRPVQAKIPLLVGGNGARLVALAGRVADIVGLTGLGRTLADGHRHEVDWRAEAIDERVAIVRNASATRTKPPTIDALVQHVEITDDRDAAALRCARISESLTPADVVGAPYALVGSVDQLVEEIAGHYARFGVSSYVVRADSIDAVAQLVERVRF